MRSCSLRIATATALCLTLPGCAASAFEPVPATPEAILAFRLRTLPRGRLVRIQRMDGTVTEGTVISTAADHVVLARETRTDTLGAASVAVIQGSAYGLGPYFRISYATSLDAIEESIAAIDKAVRALS